jgi:hypothetical protein
MAVWAVSDILGEELESEGNGDISTDVETGTEVKTGRVVKKTMLEVKTGIQMNTWTLEYKQWIESYTVASCEEGTHVMGH